MPPKKCIILLLDVTPNRSKHVCLSAGGSDTFPTTCAENSPSAGVEVRAVDNTAVRGQQIDRLRKVRVSGPIYGKKNAWSIPGTRQTSKGTVCEVKTHGPHLMHPPNVFFLDCIADSLSLIETLLVLKRPWTH